MSSLSLDAAAPAPEKKRDWKKFWNKGQLIFVVAIVAMFGYTFLNNLSLLILSRPLIPTH